MRLTVSLAIVLAAAGAVAAADWNQWRGPNRDGQAPDSPALIEQLPEEGLKPLWQIADLKGANGWSSPVVAEGKVYLYGNPNRPKKVDLPPEQYPELTKEQQAGKSEEEIKEYNELRGKEQRERRAMANTFHDVLLCVDAGTGQELWRYEAETRPINMPQSGTPAVRDGRVYFLGAGQKAYCLDAATGGKVWETPLPVKAEQHQMPSSVLVEDGVALFQAGALVGVNAESGEVLWQTNPEEAAGIYASPVLWKAGDRLMAITNLSNRHTAALDLKSGELLWKIKTEAERSSPTLIGDKLLIYSGNRGSGVICYRLSEQEPEQLWQFKGISDEGSCPVVVGDLLFVQGQKRLASLNLETGEPEWRTDLDLPNPRYTSLVAADGKVFYAFGGLLCFQAEGGEFQPLYNARISSDGQLGTVEQLRRKFNLDELEKTAEGQTRAEKLWQEQVERNRPVDCTTPALWEGKIILRYRGGLICYDLAAR